MKLKAGQLAQIANATGRGGSRGLSVKGTYSIGSASVEKLAGMLPNVPKEVLQAVNAFSGHFGGYYNPKSKKAGIILYSPHFANIDGVVINKSKSNAIYYYLCIVADLQEILQADGNIEKLTSAEIITADNLTKARENLINEIEKELAKWLSKIMLFSSQFVAIFSFKK